MSENECSESSQTAKSSNNGFNNYYHQNTVNPNLVIFLPPKCDTYSDRYGWFSFRPTCLQFLATPRWALFWLCWAAALQGLIVNGFVNVVITTIEKRYHISSTESGLIVGAYDIAGLFFLIPVAYFGDSRSKPRFMACGIMLLAMGSFTFALPYLIDGPYIYTTPNEPHLCSSSTSTPQSSSLLCENKSETSLTSSYLYVFLIAMMFNGAGASPFYTLGCTYIDENVSTATSSLYLGIYYTMAILGPAIGYISGGQLLQLYVDLGVDVSQLGLTPSSNIWVGMWWIGFFVAGIMCLILVIPISGLPRKLPNADETNAKKLIETHGNVDLSEAVRPGFGVTLKDLFVSFKIIVKNGPFMLICLAVSSDSLMIAGVSAFAPKFTEQQFGMTASTAALLVGIVALAAAGGGNFLGSFIVKKFDMKLHSILKLCIAVAITSFAFTMSFAISCPNVRFAGLNTFYENSSHTSTVNLISSCNSQCSCTESQYDPICGANNIQYYSPCYAGCQLSNKTRQLTTYDNCACISSQSNHSYQAERRRCPSSCNLLPLFLLLQFCLIFCTFLMTMPSLSATLRCVVKSQKSFALGIQWLMIRMIGTIPSPILFGSLIDLSCTLWQRSVCQMGSYGGACLHYDNASMARYMLIIMICSKVVTCASVISAYLLYKSPTKESEAVVVSNDQIMSTNSNAVISSCDNSSMNKKPFCQLSQSNSDYVITSGM